MCDAEEARNAIDRGTEVIAVAFISGAGMYGGAHPQAVDGGEIFRTERALRIEHGGDRILGSRERRAERVADCLEARLYRSSLERTLRALTVPVRFRCYDRTLFIVY
jgi:hypothetical protein